MKSLIVATMILFATPVFAQVQICIDLTAAEQTHALAANADLARCGEGGCTGGDVCEDTGSVCECVTP